ncbi:MAG: hypothetical protein M3364_02290 [Actinomycetota bacterium]|nr:hypothetical protein [Actinomycetota bacterium]
MTAQTPEEPLENLLLSRRRGFEEQVARLHETVADLERREQLLRDSRASVERILRVGTSDLERREAELADTIREVGDREERLRAGEEELARRRGELGAVELKREAVEQRERAVADREARLSEREDALTQRLHSLPDVAALAFVPGVVYRLVEIEPTPLGAGSTLELESALFVAARVGPSPLPADNRRCAYLVASSGDSS